jgi:hypothetical protein
MSIFTSISNWFKAEEAAGKRWLVYIKAVGAAALHGAWSGLSAIVGASILDASKFNVTNGLKSELDLLILVSLASGGLAAYLYVKANPAPVAPAPAAPAAK